MKTFFAMLVFLMVGFLWGQDGGQGQGSTSISMNKHQRNGNPDPEWCLEKCGDTTRRHIMVEIDNSASGVDFVLMNYYVNSITHLSIKPQILYTKLIGFDPNGDSNAASSKLVSSSINPVPTVDQTMPGNPKPYVPSKPITEFSFPQIIPAGKKLYFLMEVGILFCPSAQIDGVNIPKQSIPSGLYSLSGGFHYTFRVLPPGGQGVYSRH
jgi:hypothetical protein